MAPLANNDILLSPLDSSTATPSQSSEDDSSLSDCSGQHLSSHDDGAEDASTSESRKLKGTMHRYLGGKSSEWRSVAKKQGPLRLLDLPLDILREIVKEVTHTNDLCEIALTNSTLHALATPHIYSRFDIVWPDAYPQNESRSGVDALSFGLSTLVQDKSRYSKTPDSCHHCGNPTSRRPSYSHPQERKKGGSGNDYARHTRKFSLGNGPPDLVKEYTIGKEAGKMLATLVALAIRRMHNLESFIWDMPTGVLREVWEALASLEELEDKDSCRLERLWIRWHDNRQTDPAYTAEHDNHVDDEDQEDANLPPPLVSNSTTSGLPRDVQRSFERVQHPTLSIVPPLKSLSVLEIDELAYLDEMSMLIDRSKGRLRELRVSMARHVAKKDWVAPWEGDGAEEAVQTNPDGTTRINASRKRKGGVLGTIFSRALNSIQESRIQRRSRNIASNESSAIGGSATGEDTAQAKQLAAQPSGNGDTQVASVQRKGPVPRFVEHLPDTDMDCPDHPLLASGSALDRVVYDAYKFTDPLRSSETLFQHPLPIEILELERVPLSVNVMQAALDWSRLTELTLLDCDYSDNLWRALWHLYKPECLKQSKNAPAHAKTSLLPQDSSEYPLKLRKIHVDIISPVLISFIKKALAPNTLEVLFLQVAKNHWPNVTVEQIVRGPLRRHRASLKNLVIDSGLSADLSGAERFRYQKWKIDHESLAFIMSGKMPNVRELSFRLDHEDWHFFLRRLPALPRLRSLYIPSIDGRPQIEPKELCLQVIDMLTLRPDIPISYIGILDKCFEVLEDSNTGKTDRDGSPPWAEGMNPDDGQGNVHDGAADHIVEVPDSDGDDDDELSGTQISDDEGSESSSSETESETGKSKVQLRLREILFYDDKVSIFKVRHGRL